MLGVAEKGNARSSGYKRNAHDWYVESEFSVDALLKAESFDGLRVWDPSCGSGNIPRRCIAHGLKARGSDIVDRGCGAEVKDFLDHREPISEFIICNPPFVLAQRFVLHALRLGCPKIAIIQRLAFLEGKARHAELFQPHPPKKIWCFAPRISMPPGGADIQPKGGSVAYCWIVFERGHTGDTRFGWLI